jgi:hypothetical protein
MRKTATSPSAALVARLLRGARLAGALLWACQEDVDCTPGFCDSFALEYSSPPRAPCETLDDHSCEVSSHCILDAVCVSTRSCNGPGCADLCELVQTCVPYR